MEGMIAGRTASAMPGLDIAEQRSWQNFLDAALRLYATLNKSLVETHHLTLNDVRLLDILDKSDQGCARMGDLADELMSLPSRVTRQIHRLESQELPGTRATGSQPLRHAQRGVSGAPRHGAERAQPFDEGRAVRCRQRCSSFLAAACRTARPAR